MNKVELSLFEITPLKREFVKRCGAITPKGLPMTVAGSPLWMESESAQRTLGIGEERVHLSNAKVEMQVRAMSSLSSKWAAEDPINRSDNGTRFFFFPWEGEDWRLADKSRASCAFGV